VNEDVMVSARNAADVTRADTSPWDLSEDAPAIPEEVAAKVELSRRVRAHAYKTARDWCELETRTDDQAWVESTKQMLITEQTEFKRCIVEAFGRAPFALAEGAELTLNWRALVERDGHPRFLAQIDGHSSMRADLALCIVLAIEHAPFPKPDTEQATGSNVTFTR